MPSQSGLVSEVLLKEKPEIANILDSILSCVFGVVLVDVHVVSLITVSKGS